MSLTYTAWKHNIYWLHEPERGRFLISWAGGTIAWHRCGHFCAVMRLGACCHCAVVMSKCWICNR